MAENGNAAGTAPADAAAALAKQAREKAEVRHLKIQTFTNLVLVCGMLLVCWQLYRTAEAIRSSATDHIYSRMVDVDRMFVDRPELKPYFYNGLVVGERNVLLDTPDHLPTEIHKAQVRATAEMLGDFFSQSLQGLQGLPPDTLEGWRSYIKFVYLSSPVLQDHYHERKEWYRNELVGDLFEEADAELRKAPTLANRSKDERPAVAAAPAAPSSPLPDGDRKRPVQ